MFEKNLGQPLVGTEAEAPSTAPKTERRVISANRVSKQDLSTADPVKLTTNQAKILEQLPKEGSTVIVPNSYFGLNDLSAITSKTGGVEFAVFTMGGRRMIVCGTRHGLDSIDTNVSAELGRQGWRFTAHSHPGRSESDLKPSPGDESVLRAGNRNAKSAIVNEVGGRKLFRVIPGYLWR